MKLNMMVRTYNNSTREAGATELRVQGHPQLDLDFEVSLSYIYYVFKSIPGNSTNICQLNSILLENPEVIRKPFNLVNGDKSESVAPAKVDLHGKFIAWHIYD